MHDGAEFDQSKNIGVVQANAKKYLLPLPDPKGGGQSLRGGILQHAAKKEPTFFIPPRAIFPKQKSKQTSEQQILTEQT